MRRPSWITKGVVDTLEKERGILQEVARKKWASPMIRIGAIAAGAWVALAVISRIGRFAAADRREPAAPGFIDSVYNRVGNGGMDYSGGVDAMSYRSKFRPIPTAGLVQQQNRERSGHTKYGSARTDDQMRRLYGG